jgi:hypothetical protein
MMREIEREREKEKEKRDKDNGKSHKGGELKKKDSKTERKNRDIRRGEDRY